MKHYAWLGLFCAVTMTACRVRQPAADTTAVFGTTAQATPSASSAARADVAQACSRVATLMRSSGAKTLITADTVVDSSEYNPRQTACLVHADSFALGPRTTLFQPLLDAGWSWHPFEGTGGEDTYGFTRDSVQCDVTPTRSSVTAHKPPDPWQPAQRFHVFCYPDP